MTINVISCLALSTRKRIVPPLTARWNAISRPHHHTTTTLGPGLRSPRLQKFSTANIQSAMKRKQTSTAADAKESKVKKARVELPAYHLTPSLRDQGGEIIWPAPQDQIDEARRIILECASAGKKTLIVPDKDADGLSSGVILQRTLIPLGLDPDLITAHLLRKGGNIHDEAEREAMAAHQASYIFVLDQGSRNSPPVVDHAHTSLIIDHHYATDSDFPSGSSHVTACNSPPVATSSLLTYLICLPLHDDVASRCDWLCILGTHGDLGNTLKWEPPFPDMAAPLKTHTRKALNTAVSLINAPRRTASYTVPAAWEALSKASGPGEVLRDKDLLGAREEVNAEVDRWARTAPKFSADGSIAVFRIRSEAQIHPVIATRWAGHLSSAKLEVVLVANEGYLPGKVNFSCRVPRCARAREPPVNIIEVLKGVAARAKDETLVSRLGESFARGHKEASGGIVACAEFEELMEVLDVGGGVRKKAAAKDAGAGGKTQSNTLTNYFGKA